ncbi:MAG: adenine deaminase [Zetaproteobacteria bacterium CG12_big_fil_rev_8_21_14_0_65_54_13]|nr:MAG: adenine deaminase [Zetaproteobacteria bacterium CG12_big_fil_rev_8_21_14_0_65_54_13]PIX54752.1 MAG: adenine deaminase [Zetaproteobacteria bacterium CG_4_10_14_3_um_filter_54_28]PJA30244.1 MAG: adenine deaminase [Zetaproteobacteria bacterium CG_4_9_14_3_um_filter_54_145]
MKQSSKSRQHQIIRGQVVDLVAGRIFPGSIEMRDGRIIAVSHSDSAPDRYIVPGLVDAHIHIESSMLPPSEFARLASVHGTIATVSDPHEIANVLGVEGIRYMIANGRQVPLKFYFGAPSCVPATGFETAGAALHANDIALLLRQADIHYLSEMMNYPGVLAGDDDVMEKIRLALQHHKPVDGHAPGVHKEAAAAYAQAGISTDHECTTIEEAREKIALGMHILIREGSAAKNFAALAPLIMEHPGRCMLCSDDLHPDDLLRGHINLLVSRAIKLGYDPLSVLRCASLNPVRHYKLDVGMLQPGDAADFLLVDNLNDFHIHSTWIDGIMVAEHGRTLIPRYHPLPINRFDTGAKTPADFRVQAEGNSIRVIEAAESQLVTGSAIATARIAGNAVIADTGRDLLKIAVINRYRDATPATAFIRGFGLQRGAIASSVAHDSHNIIAVGTTDAQICRAVNLLITEQGGICAVCEDELILLPLPIAGLMSDLDGYQLAQRYAEINRFVRQLGCPMHAPFMTLSFMALLVIPSLKLSDQGLFDGDKFAFTSLFSTEAEADAAAT